MIRMIQKHLIIPRGDTGTFSIPSIATVSNGDASVFTIFDPLVHKKIFEKVMQVSDGVLTLEFTHADTVNLPVGQFVWDIKFYKNANIVDGVFINGDEIDSYYAAFKLPICEIRQTGDTLLTADDAPTTTIAPEQLNVILAAASEANNAKIDAADSAATASEAAINAAQSAEQASAALGDLQEILPTLPTKLSDLDNDVGYITDYTETDPTVPAWAKTVDKPSYTAQEVGALPNNTFIPTRISDLVDDSGHYTKPVGGIPATDLAETYLTQHQDISGKANISDLATVATSGNYNDLSNKPTIPTAISDLTDDSGHYIKPVSGIPASDLASGVLDVWSGLTYHTSTMSTDADSFVLGGATDSPTEINKCLVTSTPGANVIPKFDYQGRLHSTTPEEEWDGSNAVATTAYVDTMISNNMPEVPTNVSELNNDAGYLTSFTETDPTVPSWAKAINKPTYTASEVGAPTVSEMNTAISTAIGNVHQFGIEVVQELPTTGIKEHTVYFVPKIGETNDVYDEYIYVNNGWEMIGNTQIDLSDKADKVISATSGNFAALDANGNLTDSGHKHSDYLTQHQTIPVTDVQVNGSSVVTQGVANVPVASSSALGVVKISSGGEKGIDILPSNELRTRIASSSIIKSGIDSYRPIAPSVQHESTFYGLAKAAGDSTQSSSSNAIGTYTNDAKVAIRNMIGAFGNSNILGNGLYIDQDIETGNIYLGADVEDVQVNGTSVVSNGVANVPVATKYNHATNPSRLGVVSIGQGLNISDAGSLTTNFASDSEIKGETSYYAVITPKNANVATFYGLAKAAGDTTQSSSSNVVGTYTDTAKQKIQNMLGTNTMIAPVEDDITSGNAYAIGEMLCHDGKLYKATVAIAVGDYFIEGTNCDEVNVAEALSAQNSAISATPVEKGSANGAVQTKAYPHPNLPQFLFTQTASGLGASAFGGNTVASGNYSTAEGLRSQSTGNYSHAEGSDTISAGERSHAEGSDTLAIGGTSHAEGQRSVAYGYISKAEGYATLAYGQFSHAENYGNYETIKLTGSANTTTYTYTLSQGQTIGAVIGDAICVDQTIAFVTAKDTANNTITVSQTFGDVLNNTSVKVYHGYARGNQSHAEGSATIAYGNNQHVQGKANVIDTNETYADIVGNGTNVDSENRSNAYALGWDGSGHYKDYVYVGCNSDSTGGIRLPHDVQVNGTSIVSDGVANVPIANATTLGTVKVDGSLGVKFDSSNRLVLNGAGSGTVKTGTSATYPLTPAHSHEAAFYGLAKAAGDTTQAQSDNAVGTYTDAAKSAIQSMLGVSSLLAPSEPNLVASKAYAVGDVFTANGKLYKVTTAIAAAETIVVQNEGETVSGHSAEECKITDYAVHDVQVNGASVVSNGTANIPKATASTLGVVIPDSNGGVSVDNNGYLLLNCASADEIKAGTQTLHPIPPKRQHSAVFYGLAKAAGDTTQSQSSNAVGTYTNDARIAIRNMIGAFGPSNVSQYGLNLIYDVETNNTYLAADVQDVQVNGTSIVSNGVANVPKATDSTMGAMRTWQARGIISETYGRVYINPATADQTKAGTEQYRPIVPNTQHASAFYGLAKAAGDSTQSASDNLVGTYTDTAKAAIRTMLGVPSTSDIPNVPVTDVQVEGTTIVNNGIANIPRASSSTLGVVYAESWGGLNINANTGHIYVNGAGDSMIKTGTNTYQPITPAHASATAFYGLAKASGDATQAASDNAVGTYTDSAKASIKSMLGIVDGSTGTVDVTGTTPTITAVENTRYVCGEISTLTITPPASGICIIRFTSGTTATVLTATGVVWPEWFDATALEASRVYEICITDGYGMVMSWAL